MTQEELDKIVERHQHWIKGDVDGWEYMKADLSKANLTRADLSKADLSGADLYGADLRRADLRWANLYGANLSEANLHKADLSGADLHKANLRGANLARADLSKADLSVADLYGADLRRADLRWANLYGANLSEANLHKADLSEANLSVADLYGANLSEADKFRLGKVLDEPMTGYKKTLEGVVITAEIPAGAIVFCINGSKCRTNRAKITDMAGHNVLHSLYDNSFKYRLGLEVEIEDFNLMYNTECVSGFHFFRTRKEAEEY